MAMSMAPISFSLLPFFFFLLLSLSSATEPHHHNRAAPSTSSDLVRTSCIHASFPTVCIRTLSTYAGPATTPREVAQAAVKVSLSRASKVWDFLSALLKTSGGSSREKGPLGDCVTQMSDSVDDLRKTLGELKELRRGTFRWQMSNAETWVSAALTNEDTCLDGFKEVDGKVRSDVKRKITNVARVTSNALYLINRLDQGTRP